MVKKVNTVIYIVIFVIVSFMPFILIIAHADDFFMNKDDESGRLWLTGDHHTHTTASDGKYSMDYVVRRAKEFGLDFITITDHGGITTARKINKNYSIIQQLRTENPDILLFYGFEWNVPAGEHATFMTLPSNDELNQIKDFMSSYDRNYNLIARSEKKAMDALVYAEHMNPKPLIMINHPSRKGKYSLDELRQYDDAGSVVAGFEGAPGHQAAEYRGKYSAKDPGSSKTYGGFDIMVADVGGYWDQLLTEDRQWFITANSDFHKHPSDGGSDFFPGEYTKTYVYSKGKDYKDVMDALREGRSFVVHGDLINYMDFRLESSEGDASIGETLKCDKGDNLKVRLVVRDPDTKNNNGENPELRHVQIISDINGEPSIIKIFKSKDWNKTKEGYISIEYQINNVKDDFYLRVRGSNTDEVEPSVDFVGEDPWQDLWFYSNPIFVDVAS